MSQIAENIQKVKEELHTLSGGKCRLTAVSKTKPEEFISEAYAAGQRIFGENRVQEIVPKSEALPKDIEWHMIGHLQRNKVKYIAPIVSCIQSVDSPRLLEEIRKQAVKNDRTIACFLQVHIAEEESKFGFDETELLDFLENADSASFSHIKLSGLMGMATFTEDTAKIRSEFRNLRRIFEKVQSQFDLPFADFRELSMGMSSDYRIAAEEGSTLVRVGSAIFGSRK